MPRAKIFRPAAAQPLSDGTLRVHADRVDVPTYDRAELAPGVVHIGLGGFHRAHQAVYLDELARTGASRDWGIVGVSLRRRGMKAALAPQGGLYTVIERDADEERARVVGATRAVLFGPEDGVAIQAALADERAHLVTLTVTGGGYHLRPDSGELDASDPAIVADLSRPDAPTTMPGHLVAALARRRGAGRRPFTVLSCDNVPDNGAAAREAVVGFARLRDEVLARWIENHVSFPGSTVDRITPETTPEDRAWLAERYGVRDAWPVVTEPFRQWVVEDRFSGPRPPLEEVGVRLTTDVAPYRVTKTRLLNGTHCALGYLGVLAGHARTDEAMSDRVMRAFVTRLMRQEIAPLVPRAAGVDVDAYTRTLLERFSNPAVGDRLTRLCARGSTKMPAYLIPSLVRALRRGRPHALLTLSVAAWVRYLRGTDLAGGRLEVVDAHAESLRRLAQAGGDDPRPLLTRRDIFGGLGDHDAWVAALVRALERLDRVGARGAMAAALGADRRLAA